MERHCHWPRRSWNYAVRKWIAISRLPINSNATWKELNEVCITGIFFFFFSFICWEGLRVWFIGINEYAMIVTPLLYLIFVNLFLTTPRNRNLRLTVWEAYTFPLSYLIQLFYLFNLNIQNTIYMYTYVYNTYIHLYIPRNINYIQI